MDESREDSDDFAGKLDTNERYDHRCYICDKTFSANSNLNRHLRKIHKENVQSPFNNIKCALCPTQHPSSAMYRKHLEIHHMISVEFEELSFESKQEFQEWKERVEKQTTSQFIKSRGEKKAKNVKTYYSCNRSGIYVSKAKTQKALKKQGSRKINGRCPASINVTIDELDTHEVKYYKTHVGHDFEVEHLDLSDKDREYIAEKLNAGIPKRDLIEELRSKELLHQEHQLSILNGSDPIEVIIVEATSEGSHNWCPTASEIVVESGSIEEAKDITEEYLTNSGTACTTDNHNNSKPTYLEILETCSGNIEYSDACNLSNKRMTRLHLATTKDLHNIINSKKFKRKKDISKQQGQSSQEIVSLDQSVEFMDDGDEETAANCDVVNHENVETGKSD